VIKVGQLWQIKVHEPRRLYDPLKPIYILVLKKGLTDRWLVWDTYNNKRTFVINDFFEGLDLVATPETC
jgi:hypothetical protein